MCNGGSMRIDVVSIKTAISKGEIAFFESNGIIYCRDCQSEEVVAVGKTMEKILRETKPMPKSSTNGQI
jgi:hypothetical protein